MFGDHDIFGDRSGNTWRNYNNGDNRDEFPQRNRSYQDGFWGEGGFLNENECESNFMLTEDKIDRKERRKFLEGDSKLNQNNDLVAGNIDKRGFVSIKIGMINKAWLKNMNNPSENFELFPNKISPELFKIIGFIKSFTKSNNRMQFIIDDGTAIIPCDYMLPHDPSPYRASLIQALGMDNKYVKIYGSLNLFGKSYPNVRVHKIELIQELDEIAFHDIDVIYQVLRSKYPTDQVIVNNSMTNKKTTSTIIMNESKSALNIDEMNDSTSGFHYNRIDLNPKSAKNV